MNQCPWNKALIESTQLLIPTNMFANKFGFSETMSLFSAKTKIEPKERYAN